MELKKVIRARKSVRHFDKKKKPNWRTIIECIDAARHAPMAGNLFPLRFIIVDDPKIIEKLAEASQQPFVGEAQYVVVVTTDCKMVLNAYEGRAEKFCRQQAGAAIENVLLSLEEAGLETCWIGYFVDYLVKEALGIPDNIDVEAMLPIGYESPVLGKGRTLRKKIDLNQILYFNKYKNRRMKKKSSMDV
jgi:nitroreductase